MVHAQLLEKHGVVDREEWKKAREELLIKEKALTRERERVARARQKLPWVKVDKEYVFKAEGKEKTLDELFAGRSQLIVYHFMFGADWEEGCKSCSFLADGFDSVTPHLMARDVSLAVVSNAPPEKIEPYKLRLCWGFPWYSCGDTTFNNDYNATFDNDEGDMWKEVAGISVFFKADDGQIYHTYNTFARGLENFIHTYDFLDIVPKGRDEEKLHEPMDWVRRHPDYDFSK